MDRRFRTPGRRRGVPISLALQGSLAGNRVHHGAVNAQIGKFAVAQLAQLVLRGPVQLATGRAGGQIGAQGCKAVHQASTMGADICGMCHVVVFRLERGSVRFVDTKIGKCCICTIRQFINAAMQQMHGSTLMKTMG